jgi:hypothetical protein
MKKKTVFYQALLRSRILDIARVRNPKLKSVSSESLKAIELAFDALLVNLVTKGTAKGTRLNITPKGVKEIKSGKSSYADQVSNQMLAQLSVTEGLLKRVNNLERGQEFVISKLTRLQDSNK